MDTALQRYDNRYFGNKQLVLELRLYYLIGFIIYHLIYNGKLQPKKQATKK